MKNPKLKARAEWSAKKHSLASFLAAHAKFARKVSIVTDENPLVIDLLEKLNY
jgi:hypothetical protein